MECKKAGYLNFKNRDSKGTSPFGGVWGRAPMGFGAKPRHKITGRGARRTLLNLQTREAKKRFNSRSQRGAALTRSTFMADVSVSELLSPLQLPQPNRLCKWHAPQRCERLNTVLALHALDCVKRSPRCGAGDIAPHPTRGSGLSVSPSVTS